jgi:Fur family transcriptional regulator, ferric uptake regulator
MNTKSLVGRPSPETNWLACLQESGYRLTAPRRAIVKIIATSQFALSPLDVFDLGRPEYPGLGLVTVYRTLEKLEELNLIQRVHQPNGCHRYLPATIGHQHILLCLTCGRAEYFSGDDLTPLFSNIGEKSGYEIKDHLLQLFGICSSCHKNNSEIGRGLLA